MKELLARVKKIKVFASDTWRRGWFQAWSKPGLGVSVKTLPTIPSVNVFIAKSFDGDEKKNSQTLLENVI